MRRHPGNLIEAREKAFWTMKAIGADDLIDTIVPRGAMPKLISAARDLVATRRCRGGLRVRRRWQRAPGHLLQGSGEKEKLMTDILPLAKELGAAISGEHGVGRAKTPYFRKLEDPVKVDLVRRIKQSFDSAGTPTPDVLFMATEA